MRYAAREAAAAAPANSEPTTATVQDSSQLSALQQRRTATAATVDEALTALRDPHRSGDPDIEEAYVNAVLQHGAVIRDIAEHKINHAYTERGLDDASVNVEAAAVAQRLEQIESQWREAKRRTDNYLTADGTAFVSDAAADAIDTARNTYTAAKQDIDRQAAARSNEINTQRAAIARDVYYVELAQERGFGSAEFIPSNTAKMTKADRAMFSATTALYPDEMVQRANALGPMLAKRSKARAHYTSAARQRSRRTRTEVFDLNDALQYGRFRFNHYVDSPEEMARGSGSVRDRHGAESAFLPRTPDNERKVRELVAQYNEGRRQHATIEYATAVARDGGEPREVLYVKGPRKRVTTEVTGVSAEVTFGDSSSMVHELGHRMEDRNPEVSVATKAFLRRRTAGLPFERYHKRELVISDGFADRYMGKDYPGEHHTERSRAEWKPSRTAASGACAVRRRYSCRHREESAPLTAPSPVEPIPTIWRWCLGCWLRLTNAAHDRASCGVHEGTRKLHGTRVPTVVRSRRAAIEISEMAKRPRGGAIHRRVARAAAETTVDRPTRTMTATHCHPSRCEVVPVRAARRRRRLHPAAASAPQVRHGVIL